MLVWNHSENLSILNFQRPANKPGLTYKVENPQPYRIMTGKLWHIQAVMESVPFLVPKKHRKALHEIQCCSGLSFWPKGSFPEAPKGTLVNGVFAR
jgi:hypothetical protein